MKTMRASLLTPLTLAVLALSLLAVAQAQTEYTYQRIDVPNGTQTFPRGINARGDILGGYIDADGIGHDFLLHNGVYTNIEYPGGAAANALAINARGDIVGAVEDADGSHGFLLSDGKLTLIDYPGASFTRAFGINNAGDITGVYHTAFDFPRGFILSGGKFRNVALPGGTDLGVRGSQDNGLTMVGDELIKSDSSIRGFVRNRPSDVLLLSPTGTVFNCSHARGTNERGAVVGAFSIVNNVDECNSRPPAIGFVWKDGVYDIINPPGSHDTFAFGINDYGVVVGVVADGSVVHGFKATPKK
jgi:uncharacterized membrane protein